MGHLLKEHRSGLIVKTRVTSADGHGERDAAIVMVADVPGQHRLTDAADKGYDTRDLVACFRGMHVTPHIAQRTTRRRSAINARTTRHPGYAISQQKRKLVEQGFGWIKTIGGLRKLRHRCGPLVEWILLYGGGLQHCEVAATPGGARVRHAQDMLRAVPPSGAAAESLTSTKR